MTAICRTPKRIRPSETEGRPAIEPGRSQCKMTWLFIVAAAIIFFEAFARLDTLRDVRALNGTVAEAIQVIRDPAVSDLEKERTSRRSAVRVLKHLALTVGKIAAAVALSTIVLWALCTAFGVSFADTVAFSASLPAIAAIVPLMLVYGWLRHVLRR